MQTQEKPQAQEQVSPATKPIKFMGINHLAMVTGDMDKTVRFYRDVLGMALVGTLGKGTFGEPGSFRHYFFDMGQGNTLAFFEWPGVSTVGHKETGIPAQDGRQFDHISFCVESLEALHDLQSRLQAHEVQVTRLVDHHFIQSVYFDDPNGISLEASYWVQDITETPYYNDPNPVPAVKEQLNKSEV